jgi:hypothetical protein
MQNPAPMTLGNMRANGVQKLAARCLGRGCNHFRVLDVSAYSTRKIISCASAKLTMFAGGTPRWYHSARR